MIDILAANPGKAALVAQNHCRLVVLLAEARIGAELKAARVRGEVATREDNLRQGPEVRTSDFGTATLSEVGIPRQRAAEMKRLSEVGESAIRAAACAWLRQQMMTSDALYQALGVTRYRPLVKAQRTALPDACTPAPGGEC